MVSGAVSEDIDTNVVCMRGCPPLVLHAKFGCHDNLAVHAAGFSKSKLTDGGVGAEQCCQLHILPWSVSGCVGVSVGQYSDASSDLLSVSCGRRLYNEAALVFTGLQQQQQQKKVSTPAMGQQLEYDQLLHYSRRYRACLRTAIETAEVANDAGCQIQREILMKAEMIWHLCEIMFFDQLKGVSLVQLLLDWLCAHSRQFDISAVNVLNSDQKQDHPQYWNTLYGFVLQGRIDTARKLLRLHSSYDSVEAFSSADELLLKMPPANGWAAAAAGGAAAGGSLAEREFDWRYWQDECIRRLEVGEFGRHPRLQTLVKLLCGDTQTFEDMVVVMGSWYHLMISFLLYTKPWASKLHLRYAAEDAINVAGAGISSSTTSPPPSSSTTSSSDPNNKTIGDTSASCLNSILQAIVECDSPRLLAVLVTTFDDGWLPAHLADLLWRLPAADQQLQLSELRHQLLRQLAAAMMSNRRPALWQLALLYLDHGGPLARAQVPLYLERIEPKDDLTARKIIQAAELRSLPHVARSVARVMGVRCVRAGRHTAALSWAVTAGDAPLASQLADAAVRRYTRTGFLGGGGAVGSGVGGGGGVGSDVADLVDSLGSNVLISDRLMFLGKYREFHRLYGEGRMRECGTLLVTLITEQLAPQYFWQTLLTDAVSLLELEPPVLSSHQTHQLLECLETLKLSGVVDEDDERVRQIRRALCHNLASAYIDENDGVTLLN